NERSREPRRLAGNAGRAQTRSPRQHGRAPAPDYARGRRASAARNPRDPPVGRGSNPSIAATSGAAAFTQPNFQGNSAGTFRPSRHRVDRPIGGPTAILVPTHSANLPRATRPARTSQRDRRPGPAAPRNRGGTTNRDQERGREFSDLPV